MIVVAGVSGHVGSVVAETLLAEKHKVRVLVRDAKKGADWSKHGAEVSVGSLEDGNFLTGALRGATGFFTLLPPNFATTDFYGYQRKLADTIASSVKLAAVPHVVILSSIGADLAEGTGPIKGLNYLESALKSTGTTLSAIRAGYFQENVGNVLGAAKAAGVYPNFGDSADYPIPMIATHDIGKLVAETLLAKPAASQVIDLYGPSYTHTQVAEKLGAALGKKLQIVNIPQAGWIDALKQAGFSQHLAEIFAEMYAGFASGKIRPSGDRMVQGTSLIDDTIRMLTA